MIGRFIDTFDESGDVITRALTILTKRASELPARIRVIVSSRYHRDIQDGLQSPLASGVDVILVDDIPSHQTLRDIVTYIDHEFREVEYQTRLNALIRKAGRSFQWAATACRFISMSIRVTGLSRYYVVMKASIRCMAPS
jgi:hypothetical protein